MATPGKQNWPSDETKSVMFHHELVFSLKQTLYWGKRQESSHCAPPSISASLSDLIVKGSEELLTNSHQLYSILPWTDCTRCTLYIMGNINLQLSSYLECVQTVMLFAYLSLSRDLHLLSEIQQNFWKCLVMLENLGIYIIRSMSRSREYIKLLLNVKEIKMINRLSKKYNYTVWF